MKKAYQIDERKAIDRFRSYLATNPGNIQLVLPLADLAQRMRHGVSQMLFETERELLMLIIGDEMKWLSQEQGMARWGTAPGSVIIHSQKVPVERPRLRDRGQEAKLGSYELFRRDDEMQRRVWDRVVRGLSMRSYDPVIRESKPSFGISKSAISSRFKVASGQRAQDLRKRDLSKLRLCALMVDGVEFRKELFVVALGIDKTGTKTILGYHQGAHRKPGNLRSIAGRHRRSRAGSPAGNAGDSGRGRSRACLDPQVLRGQNPGAALPPTQTTQRLRTLR